MACEGCELRATSASAGHGYHGDGAVANQLDSGGAATGGSVDDAGDALGGLRLADLRAGAGGIAARCITAAAECGAGAGCGTDAAVAGPDAQNIALRDLQDAAELGTRASADEVGVSLLGKVRGGKGGGGSACAANQVETNAAGALRNDPFAVGPFHVVVAGGRGLEREGGGTGLDASCPRRDGGACEDDGGAPGGSPNEVAARHLRRCYGSGAGGSEIGVMRGGV